MIEEQNNTEDRILISAMVATFVHEDNAKTTCSVYRRAVILVTSDPYTLLHDKFTALQPLKVDVLWFGRRLR